jgi:hypothetical protein
MIDALKLAEADRSKPLVARDPASGFTCAICGVEAYPHTWRVTLPGRLGKACANCAGDHGFEVRFP